MSSIGFKSTGKISCRFQNLIVSRMIFAYFFLAIDPFPHLCLAYKTAILRYSNMSI